MRTMINTILLVTTIWLSAGCDDPNKINNNQPDKTKIHTIYELNQETHELDSHAGEERSSTLELDYNSFVEIPKSVLGVSTPVYSRIKKKKNGGYLLTYQDAQIGTNIYVSHSLDLSVWTQGNLLFEKKNITSSKGADTKRYSSADAVVLSNGDILVAASFRANLAYRYSPETNGIAIRRSKDNGTTWGTEQIIYVGTNWEPYLLELPSGQIHCYFTDTDPTYSNSGTSMIVSDDGGLTWSPTGTSKNYKVVRQYKYLNQGQRIYTDQMPVVRMLNDGVTLAGFMEARLETDDQPDGTSYFMMSLVYGKSNWEYLTGDAVGPIDRQTNLFRGAGGYIEQFPSGETVISCNISNKFSMKVGDSQARNFNHNSWSTDWLQPFNSSGYWGSLEVDNTHSIIGTIHKSDAIVLGRFILNHRINAQIKDIILNGKSDEWTHTDALFIGSESTTQATFRAAFDAKNLYILAERRDKYVNDGDIIELYIHNNRTNTLNDNSLKIVIDWSGITTCYKWSKNQWKESSLPCADAVNTVSGIANDINSDNGYLSEIMISLSDINPIDDYIRFNAVLVDGSVTDTFSFADTQKPDTWMLIKKQNK